MAASGKHDERVALNQIVLTLENGGAPASVYSSGSFSQRRYARDQAIPIPPVPKSAPILTHPDMNRKTKRKEVRWVDLERRGALRDYAPEEAHDPAADSDSDDEQATSPQGSHASGPEGAQLRGSKGRRGGDDDDESADGDDGSSGGGSGGDGSRRRRRVRSTLREQQRNGKGGKKKTEEKDDSSDCRQCEDLSCTVM
jgi:hypothetical protein